MIPDKKIEMLDFDLCVAQIESIRKIVEGETLLKLKVLQSDSTNNRNAFIKHHPRGNLDNLVGRKVIVAENVKAKEFLVHKSICRYKLHILMKCLEKELVLAIPPIQASIGDKIQYSNNEPLLEAYESHTVSDWENVIEDTHFSDIVKCKRGELMVELIDVKTDTIQLLLLTIFWNLK